MGAGITENLIDSGSYPPLLGKALVDAWLAVSGAMEEEVPSSGGEPGKAKPKRKTKVPAKAKAKANATTSLGRAANSSSDEELVEANPKRKAKKVRATTKVKAETKISMSRAANDSSDEELERRLRKARGQATTKVKAESSIKRAAYPSKEEPTKAKPKKQAKIRKSWATADSDSN